MTASYQTDPSILNEKAYDLTVLESAFRDFLERRCWLCSDSNKIPFNPYTKNGSWGDHVLLCTFPEMAQFLGSNPDYMPCMVPAHAGLFCVDFDNLKAEGGEFPAWALNIANEVGSYSEISQSKTGLHVFLRGEVPGPKTVGKYNHFKVEFLRNHCVTVTGIIHENLDVLRESNPAVQRFYEEACSKEEYRGNNQAKRSPPLSNAEVIDLLKKASNREKFSMLFYDGKIDAYGNDASSADFALISLICFYCQDSAQIFQIFKDSALYNNPKRQAKWKREDYRSTTIEKALASCREFYQPEKEKSAESKEWSWENPAPIQFDDEEDLDIPFPIDSLPKLMQDAILETERSVQVDPAMPIVPVLGIAALQIGKKVLVVEKEGLTHHPSLFLTCVMDQVERKSETCNRILDPIKNEIEAEMLTYKREKAAVKAHNDAVAEQITAIKKLIRDGTSKETVDDLKKRLEDLILSKKDFPPPPKNWGDDVTPQRLQQNLHIHGGAFGLFSSEARTIFHRILDKNDTEGAVSKSIYTAATWGDDLDRSRVGNAESGEAEEREVRKPALTIVAFLQRDVWDAFAKDKTMRMSGTISRICVTNPPSRAGTRLEHENDEPFRAERIAPFTAVINRIRKWKPSKSIILRLSPDAAKYRREFYNALEKEAGYGGLYEDVRDIVGRACSLASRIAAIFAVFEAAAQGELGDQLPDITGEQFLRAQALEEYFLAQGIDFQRAHQGSKDDCLARAVNWFWKCIKKKELKFLPSTLKNRVRGVGDRIDETIVDLEKRGWVRKAEKARGKSFYYEINQILFKNTKNKQPD